MKPFSKKWIKNYLKNWFPIVTLVGFILFMLLKPFPINSTYSMLAPFFLCLFGFGLTFMSFLIQGPQNKDNNSSKKTAKNNEKAKNADKINRTEINGNRVHQ